MDLNFVSEIISNHSETESKYLNDSIRSISEKITLLKLNANDKFDEKYVKFVPIIVESEGILNQATDLLQDVQVLQTRLDTQTKRDVENLTEELKTLKESLIESSTIVEEVGKLCKIHSNLQEARKKFVLKKYFETAEHINEACKLVNEDFKNLDYLDILKGLTLSITYQRDEYSRESIAEWKQCVLWTLINGDINNKQTNTSLTVSSDKYYVERLLKTLEMYDVANKEVATFSKNLLQYFLKPIMYFECNLSLKKNGISSDELWISSSSDSEKPSYKQVLENLKTVFQFLDQVLGVSISNTCFLSRLGEYIADDFLSILVDECLTDVIHLKKEHLKNHAPILEPITDFQSVLTTTRFIPESNKILEEHFGDVESLFLNKTIESYLETARCLMKRDLHEIVDLTMQVKDITSIKMEHTISKNMTYSYNSAIIDFDKLCPNVFSFPKCSISKSVEELIDLVNKILTEGLESDNKTCTKLFHLARDIIGLYPEVVPMYHAKLLHDIPQYSALLYNNLMYLAHHLLTIDYDKKSQGNTNMVPISCFADLVIPLRIKATISFGDQVMRQQKILLNLIKDSGLSALSEYEELPECTEKSIRACLKQLTLLKAVWEKVLPYKKYAEVIGGLCTVIVDEITSQIVATSDIRADIATSLVKVLSLIETEAPKLFLDNDEVYLQVKSWSKLRELILVLGASLVEVGERWADGKGPLAAEFTAEQVRQMIKALFQVSDRRATVLSRIK